MVDCIYCKANGHAGYYTDDARACPKLASISPCVYCHSSGYDNHTPRWGIFIG